MYANNRLPSFVGLLEQLLTPNSCQIINEMLNPFGIPLYSRHAQRPRIRPWSYTVRRSGPVTSCASNLGRQRPQRLLGIRGRSLDNANQSPEPGMRRITNTLIHPALAGSDSNTLFGPQPVQRDDDLGAVAAADPVGQDVHAVAGVAQVKRRLGDADVALDADEGDAGFGREDGLDGRDVHGELGLVVGWRGEEGGEGGDGGAELGGCLGGCVDGEGEGFGESEEFLGCEDAGMG